LALNVASRKEEVDDDDDDAAVVTHAKNNTHRVHRFDGMMMMWIITIFVFSSVVNNNINSSPSPKDCADANDVSDLKILRTSQGFIKF
jgi:hypothetical protein